MTFETNHARHDRAHCLCPGLFRSFVKGQRKKTPLNVEYDYGNERIEISGPQLLGAFDLRVLQGLIALSGENGLTLDLGNPKTDEGRQMALLLEPVSAESQVSLVIKGSFYQLAKEIGLSSPDGGKESKLIRDSVERLWKTSMIVEKDGERIGFRILGDNYRSTVDKKGGKLSVTLNPRIATAVMGGQHARINMTEVRALQSDAARLIHQRLCGFINAGKAHTTPIAIGTLAGYVWHDSELEKGTRGHYGRLATVRAALAELVASLGWKVEEVKKGFFTIERPVDI